MGLKAIREARAKEDKYRGDVIYETWARGGNPDAVDYDRVGDAFRDGTYAEDCASQELMRQRPTRDREPDPYFDEQEDDPLIKEEEFRAG